ncbi:thioesterase II family protein [Chlorogloeopsis sp. ULAP01]|uniref:thioesterase II family protein n=1 Tax=Chlorogloeopsis sp. ULAP01 TaxID=3056483 RepID=UPI0025AB4E5E|nr:thioesterase II family protein [Chlorogloeopsis sp. ULAP01]MDM9379441.1 thioesterase II family protein [Chlorogloeopsis sp. ULAP01]
MTTIQTFNSWVTYPKLNPQASVRLFCFPYAGGSSLIFRTWSDSLPKTVEVCPIELPGRGTQMRTAPFPRLEPLVGAIAPALIPHLNKPFAFFGHSMGAIVSFELARLLRKQYDTEPIHLFISGRRAPQILDPDPPIHALDEPAFKEELRRLNGTSETILENSELMQLLSPILRADFAVLETYVYTAEPPLDCPITAFGGLQDHKVNCEQLQAWREQTNAPFSLQMFRGDHFFLHSAQSLLLQSLSQELDRIANEVKH